MFKSRPSGGMLGSVGAKIAHTSVLPGLGNQDLRTLQELITAEKGVLVGVQRLAADVAKGAEALKNWGMGEGDDLGDVLGHSTNLLAEFSAALTQFASYEERIRLQLKSIRTREETLDEMKRRKRTVDHKADSADKKLAKMGSEHKGRMGQVELLNELKQEGRQLEIDILKEEAAIGDFKRRTTREFMTLRFAGLAELAEKTTIIGDLGKLMVEEISLQTTPPGHPRAPYTGRQKAAELSTEAKRCIDSVRLAMPELPESGPAPVGNQDPYDAGYDVGAAVHHTGEGSGAPYSEFGEGGFNGGSMRIGDDGSRLGEVPGNQYNTFPSSRNPSHFGAGPPMLGQSDHDREPTFSSSIADALAHDPGFSSAADQPPPAPPHQPSVPGGTFVPPPGLPPGPVHQPSESYFLRTLPDPTTPLPALPAMEPSPWAVGPGSPTKSRPLPIQPSQTPQPPQPPAEQGGSDLAYARDEAPSSPTGASRRAYRRKNSGEFNYPYSDDAYFVRNHAASSRPLHNDAPSPEPTSNHDHDQQELSNAAAREVSREMDTLAMAPYSSSPTRPAPTSTYGTPSEGPASLPNPYGGGSSPLPRSPPTGTPAPSLPPLAPVPTITSPPSVSSPTSTSRTIAASAFRRNVSRGDTLDGGLSAGGLSAGTQRSVSPLSVRKKSGLGDDALGSPTSPGAPPLYQPVDLEHSLGTGGRERSMSPPALGDRKPSDRGDSFWP
ncbi:hypothetical protein FRC12_007735 [Ceratobasidium sp. 428]|nr:hypothetical protein FRC12_007735 [Ceratobasidium sp. 428]